MYHVPCVPTRSLYVYAFKQLLDHLYNGISFALLNQLGGSCAVEQLLSREQPLPRFIWLIEVCQLLNHIRKLQEHMFRI